jgi:hypothetical protein
MCLWDGQAKDISPQERIIEQFISKMKDVEQVHSHHGFRIHASIQLYGAQQRRSNDLIDHIRVGMHQCGCDSKERFGLRQGRGNDHSFWSHTLPRTTNQTKRHKHISNNKL